MRIEEVAGRRVQSREVLVSLFWILLRRDSELDRQPLNQVDARLVRAHDNHPDTVPTARRTVRQVPYHEPAESATPIGDPLRDGLPFGFLVGRDALPALRQRVAAGPAAALFARIRAEADRALATDLVDRNFYGTAYGGGIGQPKGVLGAGMRVFAPTVAWPICSRARRATRSRYGAGCCAPPTPRTGAATTAAACRVRTSATGSRTGTASPAGTRAVSPAI